MPAGRQCCWANKYLAFINKQDTWADVCSWHLTCDTYSWLDFWRSLAGLFSIFCNSLGSDTDKFGLGLADLHRDTVERHPYCPLIFSQSSLHESCSVLYADFSFDTVDLSLISVCCRAFACHSSPCCQSTSQTAVASQLFCLVYRVTLIFFQKGNGSVFAFRCCTSLWDKVEELVSQPSNALLVQFCQPQAVYFPLALKWGDMREYSLMLWDWRHEVVSLRLPSRSLADPWRETKYTTASVLAGPGFYFCTRLIWVGSL